MNDNLSELLDLMRDKLPHLKSLKNGCKFKILDEYLPNELFGKICVVTDIYGRCWEDMYFVFKDESITTRQFYKDNKFFETRTPFLYNLFSLYNYDEHESKVEDFIEIIGNEPTLSDVLMWLSTLDKVEDGNRAYSHFKVFMIDKWDLSKSISFQNEEMIIALLNYAKAFAEVPSLIS
jgi:hypothetical protein